MGFINERHHQEPTEPARRRIGLLVATAMLGLLAACGTAAPTAKPTDTPAVAAGTAAATLAPTVVVPTPSADKGVITGVIMTNPSQPKPAPGLILYLADILPEAQGTPFLAAFDRVHSVRTLTDPNGRFVFADITPASYSLILDRVFQAFLLSDPKKPGADFIFVAQGGKLLDLGNLVYGVLPGGDSPP